MPPRKKTYRSSRAASGAAVDNLRDMHEATIIPPPGPKMLAIQPDGLQVPLRGAECVAVQTTSGLVRMRVSDDGAQARIDTADGYLVIVPHASNMVVMFVAR